MPIIILEEVLDEDNYGQLVQILLRHEDGSTSVKIIRRERVSNRPESEDSRGSLLKR